MSRLPFATCFLLIALPVSGGGSVETPARDDRSKVAPPRKQADAIESASEGPALPNELEQRATVLVRQLGDPSFPTRQQAAQGLRELGSAAVPVLRQAVDDVDLEVRYRAQRLLKEVRLIVHAKRLKRFQADPESVAGEELPGLQRYRKAIGDDAAARKLFVQMQRAEAELFLRWKEARTIEEERERFTAAFDGRCARIRYAMSTPGGREQLVASASALMFISADPRVQLTQQATSTIYSLGNYNDLRKKLAAESTPAPLRKVASYWVAESSGEGTLQRLLFALRNDLKAGLVPGLKAIRAAANPQEMQYALLAVGRFGTRADIPAVERLFDDRTVLAVRANKNQTRFSSQMRDVALAVAVHLSGQDPPKHYGFARLNRHAQYLFVPNTAGFSDEADREAAFEKWNRWKEDEAKREATEHG